MTLITVQAIPDGLIVNVQDESSYQETVQHDFLMQKQMEPGFPEMALCSNLLPINCPWFMCDRTQP